MGAGGKSTVESSGGELGSGTASWDLLEDANCLAVVLDRDGKIISLSRRSRNFLGCGNEAVGSDWYEMFVPDKPRETARALVEQAVAGVDSHVEHFDSAVSTAGQGLRTISWHCVPICDSTGKIEGAACMGYDVTNARPAKDMVAYQSSLIDNVNDALIARDAQLRITAWNKAAEGMYGWKASEALGKGPAEMSTLGYHGIEQEEILTRLKKEGQIRLETVQQDKRGKKMEVEVTATALRDDSGVITGFVSINRDISERKRSDEDLRSTRTYLESLINYANAPIIVWDPSFRITRFNHAFERMTGYASEEVVGRELSMLFPEEVREGALARIRQTLEGEHWESVEIPILRKDGGVRWALWNSANIHAEDGRTLVATIAQGQDITERRESEVDLRETRNYLENLFNYANAPIIVWDTGFRITRFNRAFERLTGKSANEVLGQELSILFPKGSRNESLRKIGKTLSGEHWESVEVPILRKDGSVRIVLWNSANIYGTDGKTLVATIAQGQDISERKIAEDALWSTRNYLENLLDYANAPVIVWDPSFRITRFNHAFERLTGFWADEVIGKELMMLFPEKTRASSLEKINDTLAGRYWESVEIPVLRKDGSVKVALWNSANVYAEDGKTLFATIAQGQDITHRKIAEDRMLLLNESLERQTLELEAVNKELEAFNYSVSHDLRAPLRALDGYSQMLLEDYGEKLDKEGKEHLRQVREASQRMGQLIDDLLDLSRVTRNKMDWERVNLSLVARAVVRDLQSASPERKVEVGIADDLIMQGDPRLLRIVMENLLGNAWKFTGKTDHPKIEFATMMKDGQRVFYVRDNGAGFDMSHAEKLFNPFQRLHSVAEFPGLGIGLATAMRIISRHGGHIWAEGKLAQGATFYFTDSSKKF